MVDHFVLFRYLDIIGLFRFSGGVAGGFALMPWSSNAFVGFGIDTSGKVCIVTTSCFTGANLSREFALGASCSLGLEAGLGRGEFEAGKTTEITHNNVSIVVQPGIGMSGQSDDVGRLQSLSKGFGGKTYGASIISNATCETVTKCLDLGEFFE